MQFLEKKSFFKIIPVLLELRLFTIMWSLPVFLTLVKASDSLIMAATTLAFVISVIAQLLSCQAFIITLPFIALLSPMTGFIELGGFQLLYSDLFFPLLAVQASIIVFSRFDFRFSVNFFRNRNKTYKSEKIR